MGMSDSVVMGIDTIYIQLGGLPIPNGRESYV